MKIRYGIISEYSAVKGKARVHFDDDDIVSDWLPIIFKNTLTNKEIYRESTNEHVACIMDEYSEDGVILGAIYSDVDLPPTMGDDENYIYVAGPATLTIAETGFTIKRNTETLKKLLSDTLDAIVALTVTTGTGPSGPPINLTDFEAIKTRLDDLFPA